ncbi:MAG: hypothetical protein K6E94_04440 [Elusimicrobiaceae bacterium]|nr:hypothetical protein [Elusimicrobiaceae bacterium]
MKRILVNMNRSGYFWHELDGTTLHSDNPVVKMKREISEDSHPCITAMRTYEQYNYVFMKGNGDYVLAIRDLNDPRTDGSGRSLKQHVIFEDEDKDLLLKLLAYYLSQPSKFERWITGECFLPGQNDALCKLVPFNQKIEQIKEATLNPVLKDCEFAISSLKSAEWLQEKLEIKGVNVAEHLNKLDAMKGTTFLTYGTERGPIVAPPQPPVAPPQPPVKTDHNQCEQTINQLRQEPQQLQAELEMAQKNLMKWKVYAAILAVIAGISILALLKH